MLKLFGIVLIYLSGITLAGILAVGLFLGLLLIKKQISHMTEEKWDTLVKELSSEEFEACVTDTLKGKTYSTKSLLKYLERYENLTGKWTF